MKLDEVLGEFFFGGGRFETNSYGCLVAPEEDFHVQQEKFRQVEAGTSEDADGTTHIHLFFNSCLLRVVLLLFSAIPKLVLESVNKIKVASERNTTSTFRASNILETAMPAFEYGRKAARDKFSLRRGSKGALNTFDTAFKNMLKLRSDGNVEEADDKLHEDCYHFLGEK